MAAQKGDNHGSSQLATQERESEINSSMGSASAFDNSPLHLIVEKLNGKNYREWAQTIKLVIDGKGKLGFLIGETWRPPPTNTIASHKWRSENSFITSCLINSMKPTIGKTYMFLPTINDHGDREVTEYYTEMLGLWQDLDLSCEEEWECTCDSVHFKKKMENERVFEFLAGPNRELDYVRSRVLSCRLLPSIREDLSSGKMIGSAKECEGLYYFDKTDVRGQCPSTVCNSASHPKENWPLHQFDIKNAFLNGELEEKVFMTLPPGFCKEEEETRAQLDHTMFFKQSNDGRMTILIVYVDDIILTGDNTREMDRLKKVLAIEFEVKYLGQMRYFLGIEVTRSKKGISISHRKYVLDLLIETDMLGCKPSDIPIKARKRTKSDGIPVDREKYQRLVDRLIYLSHTRPDIAFAVSVVSQYMHSPKESHLEAVYEILRYLKGSPGR
ncbi:Retrovirus-related Pol polyprotein from transposon RE2 [Vitis vinifera]|uniref:Retrovirus-related Pol polyprotein from transposon RE2 n=1 Tax=Vitis vinifera TaxID=29760 RepID=A0A438EGG1_VITVI|nr:Retrovirus-related Pol polyprotein from transposon RE2 [Vitis vinifera]